MTEYKYYTQEGSRYFSKPSVFNLALFLISGLGFLYLAFFVVNDSAKAGKIVLILLGLLMLVGAYAQKREKAVIDIAARTVSMKTGAYGKEVVYSFDDFTRFEVQKFSYLGLITTNVSAMICFLNEKGKEKKLLLKHFFGRTRPAQHIIDETEDIMKKAVVL